MSVVFVHGVPDTYRLWDRVRHQLSRPDIVALALPGFNSPVPNGFTLQGLNHLQAVALVDAVERYWVREQVNRNELLETKLFRVDLLKCCDFAL